MKIRYLAAAFLAVAVAAAASTARARVSVGETVELGVDPRRLHFFDLETGLGIAAVEVPAAVLTH